MEIPPIGTKGNTEVIFIASLSFTHNYSPLRRPGLRERAAAQTGPVVHGRVTGEVHSRSPVPGGMKKKTPVPIQPPFPSQIVSLLSSLYSPNKVVNEETVGEIRTLFPDPVFLSSPLCRPKLPFCFSRQWAIRPST